MGEVVPIKTGRGGNSDGPSGSGPEGPDLENRVSLIENRLERVEAILVRLEPKITEIAIELKQVPKFSDYARLQSDIAEIRGKTATQADLQSARIDLAEVKGRVNSLPTWWMLITAIVATWTAGAGILRTVLRFAKP